jgi:hypothetical protein
MDPLDNALLSEALELARLGVLDPVMLADLVGEPSLEPANVTVLIRRRPGAALSSLTSIVSLTVTDEAVPLGFVLGLLVGTRTGHLGQDDLKADLLSLLLGSLQGNTEWLVVAGLLVLPIFPNPRKVFPLAVLVRLVGLDLAGSPNDCFDRPLPPFPSSRPFAPFPLPLGTVPSKLFQPFPLPLPTDADVDCLFSLGGFSYGDSLVAFRFILSNRKPETFDNT